MLWQLSLQVNERSHVPCLSPACTCTCRYDQLYYLTPFFEPYIAALLSLRLPRGGPWAPLSRTSLTRKARLMPRSGGGQAPHPVSPRSPSSTWAGQQQVRG